MKIHDHKRKLQLQKYFFKWGKEVKLRKVKNQIEILTPVQPKRGNHKKFYSLIWSGEAEGELGYRKSAGKNIIKAESNKNSPQVKTTPIQHNKKILNYLFEKENYKEMKPKEANIDLSKEIALTEMMHLSGCRSKSNSMEENRNLMDIDLILNTPTTVITNTKNVSTQIENPCKNLSEEIQNKGIHQGTQYSRADIYKLLYTSYSKEIRNIINKKGLEEKSLKRSTSTSGRNSNLLQNKERDSKLSIAAEYVSGPEHRINKSYSTNYNSNSNLPTSKIRILKLVSRKVSSRNESPSPERKVDTMTDGNVFIRLNKDVQHRTQVIRNNKQEYSAKEIGQCTFRPNITHLPQNIYKVNNLLDQKIIMGKEECTDSVVSGMTSGRLSDRDKNKNTKQESERPQTDRSVLYTNKLNQKIEKILGSKISSQKSLISNKTPSVPEIPDFMQKKIRKISTSREEIRVEGEYEEAKYINYTQPDSPNCKEKTDETLLWTLPSEDLNQNLHNTSKKKKKQNIKINSKSFMIAPKNIIKNNYITKNTKTKHSKTHKLDKTKSDIAIVTNKNDSNSPTTIKLLAEAKSSNKYSLKNKKMLDKKQKINGESEKNIFDRFNEGVLGRANGGTVSSLATKKQVHINSDSGRKAKSKKRNIFPPVNLYIYIYI